jgi:type IV secretory pathway TrbL component
MGFLIEIVIVLVVVGLVLWAVQQIPMDPAIARMIRVVVIVGVVLWLLYFLSGFVNGLPPFAPRR